MDFHWHLFQWRSLKTRVTVFTLAIFLLSIWSMAYFTSRMLRDDLQRMLGEQQISTVKLIASNVNYELDLRLKSLGNVAMLVTPAMLDNASVMQAMLAQHPVTQSLFNGGILVINREGTAMAELPLSAQRIGLNYRDRDYLQTVLLQGQSTISQPLIGDKPQLPLITIAVPIRNAQDQVVGAMVGVVILSLPNFLDRITNNIYGKTGGTFLVTPHNRMIVSTSDKSRVMEVLPAPGVSPWIDRFMQGYEGSAIVLNPHGLEVLVSVMQIPIAGWYASVILPTTEAFAPIQALQRRMLTATLLLTLLAGALTWWMLRRQLSPLLDTTKTLLALSNSDKQPQPLPITRQDEIGELIGGFNHLLRTLSQRQAALQESESRFRALAENASALVWLAGVDSLCYYFNNIWLDFTGRSLEQEQSNGWTEGVHPDDLEHCMGTYTRAFQARESFSMDYRLRRFDGEYRWLTDHGVPRHDEQGAFLGYVGTCIDITDRIQGEKFEQFRNHILELLTGAETLPSLIEAIAHGIEQINPEALCSIMLLGNDDKYLRAGNVAKLPDFYNTAIDGIEIGMGVGSCGTAAFTGERVIVDDIQTHPYWTPFKEVAARAGLAACWSQPILSSSGTVLGTFAIYHRHSHTPTPADITLIEQSARLTSIAIERKQSEKYLHLAASVFTHTREGIMITAADGTIMDANEAFSNITGYTRAEVLGHNPRMLSSGQHDKAFYTAMWNVLLTQGQWHGEIWNRRKSGEVYVEMQTISAVRDVQGVTQHYVSLFSDISALKAHERQLEQIAHFDALTSLPNRSLLIDRLHQATVQTLRRGQKLAVVFLDLDGFKAVNDCHGHDAGDQLLMTIANRMKQTLREGDTLARLGGDEFVAVLMDLTCQDASVPMLKRLLAAAAEPVQFHDSLLQVSASLGVTFYPQTQDMEADQLLRQADQAMYQAKLQGKNRYQIFDAG